MTDKPIDKSFVGKYLCYVKMNGSFTWAYIIDQGFVNTARGEREVFIVSDQLTLRVADNEMERRALGKISAMIESGMAGPGYLMGSPKELPDYQKENKNLLIEEEKDEKNDAESLVSSTSEGQGLVPYIEEEMGLVKSKGLRMQQKVGHVETKAGKQIDFSVRRFGYNTIVHKDSLNLQTDVFDPESEIFAGMNEEEMFYKALQMKTSKNPK